MQNILEQDARQGNKKHGLFIYKKNNLVGLGYFFRKWGQGKYLKFGEYMHQIKKIYNILFLPINLIYR